LKISELLTSLNINHVKIKEKDDIDIPDMDHMWVGMGSTITLVHHTDASIDGVMIPWVTVGFDPLTMWKIKERTLLDQLDWYNKLKGELTIACKNRTNINTLSISLLQLELVCNYYKGYEIHDQFLVKVK
jgi:hypothetical protein